MRPQFLITSAMCIALTGCPSFVKAPGPRFSQLAPPRGKAIVYFYRPAKKIMSDYPVFMSIPESADNCYRLESGGYTAFVGHPGVVTVAAAMTDYVRFTLDLRSGEERYVKVEFVDDKPVLHEVSAEAARPDIAETLGIVRCEKQVRGSAADTSAPAGLF